MKKINKIFLKSILITFLINAFPQMAEAKRVPAKNQKKDEKVKIIGIVSSVGYKNPSRILNLTSLELIEKYIQALSVACKNMKVEFVIIPRFTDKIDKYANFIDALLVAGPLYKEKGEFKLQEMLIKIGNNESKIEESVKQSDIPKEIYAKEQYANEFEIQMIKKIESQKKPILGIDSGMHMMGIARGATISFIRQGSQVEHAKEGYESKHDILLEENTKLHNILKQKTVPGAISSHTKAITELPDSLIVSGKAQDGIIEAIEDPNLPFFIGLQWHLESSQQSISSYKIGKEFCEAVIQGNKYTK